MLATVAIVIGQRLGSSRRLEQRPCQADPIDRVIGKGQFDPPASPASRQRPVVRRDRGRTLARDRKAEGKRGKPLDADADILQRRLTGNRVDARSCERADAAPAPRSGRSSASARIRCLRAGGRSPARGPARRHGCWRRARCRRRPIPKRAASDGLISTKGSATCCDRRGLLPVRVMVCHWSRRRPRVERQREGRAGAAFAALAHGDEARPAVRRGEAAVAEEAAVPGAAPQPGAAMATARSASYACVADAGQCADVEQPRALVLEGRQRGMLAEDRGRRSRRRRRLQSPCGARRRR